MTDRVAVVTGAFGALGKAVVQAALAAGYRVAAVDLAPAPGTAPAGALEIGGTDLSEATQAAAAIDQAVAAFGRLDVLINTAGGFAWQSTQDGDPANWGRLHRLNVLTTLHASRAALPHLLDGGGGRIINVGANAAGKAAGGMGAYAASKAGVHRLTEALADELKGKGVTVNAVLPSIIDTPANRADMGDADFTQWVAPGELAAVILFLASPAASAVTGALIPVTGGL